MKRIILIAALLSLGACASAPTMQTRYGLDGAGNLTQQQYIVDGSDTNSKVWESVAVIGAGIIGFYFIGELFDVWDSDDPAPVASSPGLTASGGTSMTEWTTDFIYPSWTEL